MTPRDADRPQLARRAILPALLLPLFPVNSARADAEVARPLLELPAFDRARGELLKALLSSDGFRQSLTGQGAMPIPPPAARNARDAVHARRIHGAYLALAGRRLSAAQSAGITAEIAFEDAFRDQRLGGRQAVTVSGTDLLDQIARWLRVIAALAILPPEGLRRSAFDEGALFTALRRQVAQGYASTPILTALPEPERRELAIWLLSNWSDMFSAVLDLGLGGGPVPDALRDLQARCRSALREFGLDADIVRLSEAGLRNR